MEGLQPGSRPAKSRRSASAAVVARPVTAAMAVATRRGTSMRLHSHDVAVRVLPSSAHPRPVEPLGKTGCDDELDQFLHAD